ncbi:MAG: acyl-CoA dehydratase activase [Candidatus Krumholzibacteriia bacterium]|nr:3-hydroxyacyl-ACP dehydratase [bacterium]
MRTAGVDIGSRSIELVLLEDGEPLLARREDSTFDPLAQCERLLGELDAAGGAEAVTVTGYGRELFASRWPARIVTEIRAHARGAAALFPDARTVLDIGGQDTKAIRLAPGGGRPVKFEMNDRCAAGTGKFLEFMASGLNVPLQDFGAFALGGQPGVELSSMCTVFAESEATGLVARGTPAADIARALHLSVVRRSASMLRRVGMEDPVIFTGGVARNPCIVALLEEALGVTLRLPEAPEMVGALGAAHLAAEAAVASGGGNATGRL